MTAAPAERTATLDRARLAPLDAPGRLAAALAAGGNLANAQRLLKLAGYPVSITSGKNDGADPGDGLFAAHAVNVPDAGWSFSASGSPGHEECCAGRSRGLYQGTRLAGALPYIRKRLMVPDGRVSVAMFLMSATADGPGVVITWDQVDRGRVFHRLSIPASKSPRVREALTTVINDMAYDPALPQQPHAPTPSARTPDGRIPVPEWATMPPGYGDQPPGAPASPERAAARAEQARIAAASPQIALIMGASLAGPFAAAAGIQPTLWEQVDGAGAGKTTTMQFAAAMWGCPSLPPEPGILASWDASAKGMGRIGGYLGILPLFADESGTADFAPAEWARFVYGQTQGASRLTSSVDGEPRRTPGWRGFMFLSGNGSITENVRSGKYAGVPRRVITLGGPFTLSAADCDALAAAITGDYGHLGPAVLEAVTVDQFRQWHREALQELGDLDGPTLNTNATQLAAAVAIQRAADAILGTGGTLRAAALAAARAYLATATEPESNREIALRMLAESLAANRAAWPNREAYETTGKPDDSAPGYPRQVPLHGVAAQVAGARDDEWLYVLGATWETLTAEAGITGTLALADMHGRGELHVPASWRARREWTAPGPNWLQGRPPVYKIRLSAVVNAAPADDDTAAPAPEPEPVTTEPAPAPAPAQEPLPEAPGPLAGGWGPGTIGEAAHAEAAAADRYSSPAPADVRNPADGVRISGCEHPAADGDDHQDHAAPAADPRAAWLAATWIRPDNREHFKTASRRAALTRIVTQLDENPDLADKDAVSALADSLHVLAELEGHGQDFGGPFLPTLRGKPAWLRPWKRGNLPGAAELAMIIEGYGFERSDYHGPVTVFDRNGAWIGAIGTTLVAHGALTQTGECEPPASSTPPGYYLTTVYPWTEDGMPSPLATAKPGTQTWVAAPTMGLLAELAAAGRWPDAVAVDSWTGTPVRLDAWGRLIRELRRYALENHGYGSGAYQAAKDAVSKSVSMMNGTRAEGSSRVWAKCKNQRIDWRHQVITNSAVFTWRCMDRCRQLADGNPDLAPIGIRAKDELLIPAAAATLVTTRPYPGGSRPPIRVDPTGVELGTFKVKGEETR